MSIQKIHCWLYVVNFLTCYLVSKSTVLICNLLGCISAKMSTTVSILTSWSEWMCIKAREVSLSCVIPALVKFLSLRNVVHIHRKWLAKYMRFVVMCVYFDTHLYHNQLEPWHKNKVTLLARCFIFHLVCSCMKRSDDGISVWKLATSISISHVTAGTKTSSLYACSSSHWWEMRFDFSNNVIQKKSMATLNLYQSSTVSASALV